VFAGVDRDTNNEIVLKINRDKDMNKIESNVLKMLNQKGYKHFPKLI
jgi:hypothetical protein